MNLGYLTHLAKLGADDLHPGGHKATLALLDALDLHPGNRTLEIGCGTGGTIVQLLHKYAVTVYGIEILPAMLAVAMPRLRLSGMSSQAHLMRSDCSYLPFSDQSFDRVYTESVLGFQNITVAKVMLHETHRVLKLNGRYVANEAIWKPGVAPEVVDAINRACESDFGLRQATDQAWSLDDWLEVIQQSGFYVRSADLLNTHLPAVGTGREKPLAFGVLISWLLTRFYRIRSYISPRTLVRHLKYLKHLRNHRNDRQYIEGRLFVLQKL